MRRLPVIAFAALTAATVAAFFVSQHLKVSTPVIGANITSPEPFSPGPHGCRQTTHTSFYLQHRADDVDIYVIDQSGMIIRTIAVGHHMRKGVRIPDGIFVWNGREDSGRLAPDGTYYFRVGLRNQGRSIDLTGYPIMLKTAPPRPVVTRVSAADRTPAVIPAGRTGARIQYAGTGGRNGTIRIYRTDLAGKPRVVKSFITPAKGSQVSWDGLIGSRPAPAGVYLVGLDVTDRACNTGHFPPILPPIPGSTPDAGVTVRYLAAQSPLDAVAAGSRALVLVDSRQHRYSWGLRRAGSARVLAKGSATGYQLHVPIPRGAAGLYQLALRSGQNRTEVPLVVRAARPRRGVLVVAPMLTWLGQDRVDDDGDGIPDTLDGGAGIQLDRVLVNGPPAGFAALTSLLAFLNKAHLQYDLTTDTGLLDGSAPQLAGHPGVVLAGDERWMPATLATALRAYVQRGGRLVSLGIDSLVRQVSVKSGSRGPLAVDPTAPSATDIFGARPGSVTGISGEVLVIKDELGIFTDTSQAFPGFATYQLVAPPAGYGGPLSLAGVASPSPAITGFKLGAGAVTEVGLPKFGLSLASNVDAQELTRRLWTLLSG